LVYEVTQLNNGTLIDRRITDAEITTGDRQFYVSDMITPQNSTGNFTMSTHRKCKTTSTSKTV